MILVVDASVAVKWFVPEPLHRPALSLLDKPELLHAPDLLLAELANVLWKKVLRGEVLRAQAERVVADFGREVPTLHTLGSFSQRALELALALGHPVYDCLYLACAEALDGALVTADERLLRIARAGGLGGRVQPLAMMP